MKPEQVPDELVAAAQQADVDWMRRRLRGDGIGGSWQAVPEAQVRRLLAAVLDAYAAKVMRNVTVKHWDDTLTTIVTDSVNERIADLTRDIREQVAKEIEAHPGPIGYGFWGDIRDRKAAARIARGEQ